MSNHRFKLEIGGIYRFEKQNIPECVHFFFKTEKQAVEQLNNAVAMSPTFSEQIFTVVSNVKSPYNDWVKNPSIVGIIIDNKKFYFRMNNNMFLWNLGIVEVYDVELAIKEFTSILYDK